MSFEDQGNYNIWYCPKCETRNGGKACTVCGTARPTTDADHIFDKKYDFVDQGSYSGKTSKCNETTNDETSRKQKITTWLLICSFICTVCLAAVLIYVLKNKPEEKNAVVIANPVETIVETTTPVATTEAAIVPTQTVTVATEATIQREIPQLRNGDIVYLGTYKNDKYGANKQEIPWEVLEVQDNKALLLSCYALDTVQYNGKYASTTWADSDIREWLNKSFMYEAFTSSERQCIDLTYVDNSASQGYSLWNTVGGENTEDYIFLLSYTEAKKYFDITAPGTDGPVKARILPTDYAIERGAYVSDEFQTFEGQYATRWWLRSPGCNQFDAACVHSRGCVGEHKCTNEDTCIRPAMWIDLEKFYN